MIEALARYIHIHLTRPVPQCNSPTTDPLPQMSQKEQRLLIDRAQWAGRRDPGHYGMN